MSLRITYYLLMTFLLMCLYTNAQLSAQLVPGTKTSLVPPDGFIPAANFTGFVNSEKGASMVVVEIPGPFGKVTEGMTADKLTSGGMRLVAKDTLSFHQGTAIMLTVTQTANGMDYKQLILIFGNPSRTTMIKAAFPKASGDLEEPLKTSLLTATYNEEQVSDPLKAVAFEVHPEPQGFKLANAIMGTLSYTLDGKTVTKHPDNVSFMVARSIGTDTVTNQKAYAIERFNKLPGAHLYQLNTVSPVTINELNGIELVAIDKQTQGLMYQVMLFTNENSYYLMIGMAVKNAHVYQQQFRAITRTFKRK